MFRATGQYSRFIKPDHLKESNIIDLDVFVNSLRIFIVILVGRIRLIYQQSAVIS